MSVKIPSSLSIDIGLDDIDLDGDLDVKIPTAYAISIADLPQVDIKLRPLDINLHPLDINLRPLDINLRPLEIKPIDVSLRLKEIPAIRAHFPLNYKLGFSLFGRELAGINLCGQGQFITEPYQAYPCEPQPTPARQALINATTKPGSKKAAKP